MAPATHGLLGRILRANDDAARRFGSNTAEVESFIGAIGHLTPWQWRQVLTARLLVASVTKEELGDPATAVKQIRAAIRSSDGGLTEPMLHAGETLLQSMDKRSDEKLVAAWQATSALVMRLHLSPLKFAAHYAPFVTLVPVSGFDTLEPIAMRYLAALQSLSRDKCETLAIRWRVDPDASKALVQVVAKNRYLKSEEAAALIALRTIPSHLTGDAGWAAVRTAVHGGRVLGARGELSREQIEVLWAPLQEVIPLASIDDPKARAGRARAKAVVARATKSVKAPAPVAAAVAAPVRRIAVASARQPAPYGPNSTEVTAFLKGVVELSAIQWLRVLDRRQLVASVTKEGTSEPAGAVRALLAAIKGTRNLTTYTRTRAFAAVELATHAVEAKSRPDGAEAARHYGGFGKIVPLGYVDVDGFAKLVGALSDNDWGQVAQTAPDVDEDVVVPLVNAGTALQEFLEGRTDEETVAAWHAVCALVRRHHLTPIKFAASYAPFASAIPVTSQRSLGAPVLRYVSAVGRLSAKQCAQLAQPWQMEEEVSRALAKATADTSTRNAEEAAALAAVVTVPMRITGGDGWAAAKTAAFGGRVMGARNKLTQEQMVSLWKPVEPAIPLISLGTVARASRLRA